MATATAASAPGKNLMLTMPRAGRQLQQAGFLLVESLVALFIVGTGILAAVVALSTASIATSESRNGATAAWVVTSQAELIKASTYVSEPTPYPTITPPSGFTVQNTTSAFNGGNPYIQRVTIDVYKGGQLVESVDMLKVNN